MEAVLRQLDAELEVTTEDGYTVSANYTGEVAKTGCDVVTYTAIFGSVEAPDDAQTPDGSGVSDAEKVPFNAASLKQPLLIVGLVAVVAVAFKKIKERR